jgi:DNA gyrase/topoisomerase IV subunit B
MDETNEEMNQQQPLTEGQFGETLNRSEVDSLKADDLAEETFQESLNYNPDEGDTVAEKKVEEEYLDAED